MTQTAPGASSSPAGAFATDEARWDAMLRRDRTGDGLFVCAVRTTGIYCRPGCPAKTPKRENVAFHATPADAERAGFRPCRRCRPNEPSQDERQAQAVTAACRLIEAAEEPPTLAELAASAGLSPHHFHRIFRRVAGVTPKAYAAAHRAGRLASGLRTAETVTAAIYDAGFNAPSRFYEASNATLGMTPTAYRDGGKGAEIRFAVAESSLGPILVAATSKGVCAIRLGDDPDALVRALQDDFPKARLVGGDPAFEATVGAVVALVETPHARPAADLPLDIGGTAFQRRVWQALREIPAGSTSTYTEIAARVGQPAAVRAVAGACAANELALAIPCHRVIRSDGSLSGYRWGVERKRALLAREATPAAEPAR